MKINLGLDFKAIIERINIEKQGFKPGEWANKVGVSINIVSNVHGKTRQKPSLEYIIAVSLATGKPVGYYLWGDDESKAIENHLLYEPISTYGENIPASTEIPQQYQLSDLAKQLTLKLLALERLNPEALEDVDDFIEFQMQKYQTK